jgi:hypothetical protein
MLFSLLLLSFSVRRQSLFLSFLSSNIRLSVNYRVGTWTITGRRSVEGSCPTCISRCSELADTLGTMGRSSFGFVLGSFRLGLLLLTILTQLQLLLWYARAATHHEGQSRPDAAHRE